MSYSNKDEVVLSILIAEDSGIDKRTLNEKCKDVMDRTSYMDSINHLLRHGVISIDSSNLIGFPTDLPAALPKSIRGADSYLSRFYPDGSVSFKDDKDYSGTSGTVLKTKTKSGETKSVAVAPEVTFEEQSKKQKKIAEAFGDSSEVVAVTQDAQVVPLDAVMEDEEKEAIEKGNLVYLSGNFPTDVIRASKDIYFVDKCPTYVDNQNILLKIEGHIAAGEDMLLIGEKGTGKTVAVYNIAKMRNAPLIRVQCSRGTVPEKLLGHYILGAGNSMVFKLGAIPTAIEIANETGFAILLFDEVNALNEETQKILNPVTDWRKEIVVEEIGAVFNLKKGAKLFVIASANPTGYGGTFDFNEELVSRFSFTRVTYMTKAEENRVLIKNVPDCPQDFIDSLTKIAEDLRSTVIAGEIRYAPSIRDLESLSRLYVEFSKLNLGDKTTISVTLSHLLDKYETEERNIVVSKLIQVFGDL